jgi:hypothetical protein
VIERWLLHHAKGHNPSDHPEPPGDVADGEETIPPCLVVRPLEHWEILLKDHHEGYIPISDSQIGDLTEGGEAGRELSASRRRSWDLLLQPLPPIEVGLFTTA